GAHHDVRGQIAHQLRVASTQQHVVAHHRSAQQFENFQHRLPPLLLASPLQPCQPDVFLIGASFFVWQMRQFQRHHRAIHYHRRPQAGAYAKEQHPSALVSTEGLHRGVVDKPQRLGEVLFVVEVDPPLSQVVRFFDRPMVYHGPRIAHRDAVVLPGFGGIQYLVAHALGRHVRAGRDLDWNRIVGRGDLHVCSADIDYQNLHVRRIVAALAYHFTLSRVYNGNRPAIPPSTGGTMSTETTPDFSAIKVKQQATWATGNYAVIGSSILIVPELLVEAMDIRSGWNVLDVAAGNGNASLAAARRWCKVTSTDYVPDLLERGKVRAAADGYTIDFQVADVENLPFADGTFDAVLSTFGVMFAPDQARSAAEMFRVCKPGGKIGLANWTPAGFVGQIFKTIGKYLPPPAGLKPPALWGTEDRLDELFPTASSIKAN